MWILWQDYGIRVTVISLKTTLKAFALRISSCSVVPVSVIRSGIDR